MQRSHVIRLNPTPEQEAYFRKACGVACQRQDTLHKMTTHLAQHYALIGLEDLNTKGMLANHCLAQSVSDASFFEVQRQLLYKTEQYGGYVQLVDRWYPSSKTCHECFWVKKDLTLAMHGPVNNVVRSMSGISMHL
jgi:IS605 OrfB family transposase